MPVESKPLFRPDVLRPHLSAFQWPPENLDDIRTHLKKWGAMFQSGRADKFNEKELLPDFLTDIFCNVLGYKRPADNAERFTFSREKHVQVDGKFADAVLGNFRPSGNEYTVALEGKGPLDPLDRPHAGRKMSAVDQGYRYAINLPADWIIVTSMRETRLYHKGSNQYTFERFDIERLADDDALLKRFLFLLGADRVVPESGPCHLYGLLASSEKVGKELTRDFYGRYADMRQNAFDQICADNPTASRFELLSATQKLLDRILFVSFCEDRGLLPADTIQGAYEHRDPYHPRPIWDNFLGLFRAIDTGNEGLKIPAYNGGLFAFDDVLDKLELTDGVCAYFQELADYDYRPPGEVSAESASDGQLIDVDILGHIFEQSITDLERIRNNIDSPEVTKPREQKKTRRKKEGAFYTPAFITRYIVEQTLGGVLADRFETLRNKHQSKAKGTARKSLESPDVYELDKLNEPQTKALVEFWEAWQDELKTVRVLDPACGSGAFLIEAFDQLHTVYQSSNDRLEELRGSRSLFDPDRQILQHNLYGVDLNDEAIEICRLSLWIKTAARGKVLTSLDHTIRVGNSVVTDPGVHPRALDWKAAFPEVFEQGGFDVVVGNPPYIRQEWLAPFKPHWKEVFATFDGVADIFTYFFEVGSNLLRDNGRLGFITSGSWVRGNFGAPLRKFLAESVAIESMIDFGEYQPFQDAEMIRPSIAILRKDAPGGSMKLFKWLTTGSPPENLSDVIKDSSTMRTDHLGSDAWELETDDVRTLKHKLKVAGSSLGSFSKAEIRRGILSGLISAFVIDSATRDQLIASDEKSQELIRPFRKGSQIRPWHIEDTDAFLLAIKSSGNHVWPWSNAPTDDEAEECFKSTYPAIHSHLTQFRDAAIARTDQGRFWWELRACGYWDELDLPKVVWPDISKQPRFSLDTEGRYFDNTGYMIASADYFLLGIMSSWATWFFISKTAQPLRLRGDRWQYRLFDQFMEHVPIPAASDEERHAIAILAERSSEIGVQRNELETRVQRRLEQAFGQGGAGESLGKLNNKAQEWWAHSLNELGTELKKSFRLKASPFKKPQTADEWESYLAETQSEHAKLTQQLAAAEAEINDRVYKLFDLTPDEIKLLQREVEH
ncbi:MAG: N-6 DNA methylase [Rhodopirellula sp.]|nr:N-6 DNA methylase [Rhodopirellula sp.]